MSTTKEEFYDAKISPLIAEVIKLCKERCINAFMTFALDPSDDGPLYCTTSLPIDRECEGFRKVETLWGVQKGRLVTSPTFMAFTITTGKADASQ